MAALQAGAHMFQAMLPRSIWAEELTLLQGLGSGSSSSSCSPPRAPPAKQLAALPCQSYTLTAHLASSSNSRTIVSACICGALMSFMRRRQNLAGRASSSAAAASSLLSSSFRQRRWLTCAHAQAAPAAATPGISDEEDESTLVLLDLPMIRNQAEESTEARTASIIQHRLRVDRSYQGALKLVEEYLDRFSMLNMVTALGQCGKAAKVEGEAVARSIRADANFVRMVRRLREEVKTNVSRCSGMMLARLVWSCVQLKILDVELFSQILGDATTRLDQFRTGDFALLVHAAGQLGVNPPATFTQALAREVRRRIASDFSAQTMGVITYACAKLGLKDQRILSATADWILQCDDEEIGDSVAIFLWSYGKLEYFEHPVFAKLSRCLMGQLPQGRLAANQLCMCAEGLVASAVSLPDSLYTVEELGRVSVPWLREFDTTSLALFALQMGKAAVLRGQDVASDIGSMAFVGTMASKPQNTDPLPIAIIAEIIGKKTTSRDALSPRTRPTRDFDDISSKELLFCTYALMRMECRDFDYLSRTSPIFARRAPELQSVAITNLLYAYAKMDFIHSNMILALIDEVRRRDMVKDWDSKTIAQVAWSMGTLGLHDEWLMNEILERFIIVINNAETEIQQISMVLWACAVLDVQSNKAELVTSICLQEVCRQQELGTLTMDCEASCHIIVWASVIWAGAAPGLWLLKVLFFSRSPLISGSKQQEQFSPSENAFTMMMHAVYATLNVAGVHCRALPGWDDCWKHYEEQTGEMIMGRQHRDLERCLGAGGLEHETNALVEALKDKPAPLVFADLIVPRLNLVIEVEGPQRYYTTLKALRGLNSKVSGSRTETLSRVQKRADLSGPKLIHQVGPSVWKRRLLKSCGWKAITCQFSDNEDTLASALVRIVEKMSKDSAGEDVTGSQEPDWPRHQLEAYYGELKQAHEKAMLDLERRLAEEKGDAAATSTGTGFKNYSAFRLWQANLEQRLFQEMVASLDGGPARAP